MWQKEYMKLKLPSLIETTTVNGILLANLRQQNVLGRADVYDIRSRSSRLAQVNALYQILMTRANGFECLLEALLKCNQTESAQILLDGKRQNEANDENESDSEESEAELEDPILFVESSELAPTNDNITFTSCVDGLNTFMTPSSKVGLVLIHSIDPKLTVKKIQDTFSKDYLHIKKFSRWLHAISSIVKLKFRIVGAKATTSTAFIIHDNNVEEDTTDRYKNLLQWLLSTKRNRNIVILPQSLQTLESYKLNYFTKSDIDKIEILTDHFKWDELSASAQNTILSRDILNHGRLVNLNKFCKSYVYENEEMFRRTILKDQLLVDLLNYKAPPVLLRQTIPPVKNNYIARRIRSRDRISKSIFQNCPKNEVVLFTGFDCLESLKLFAGKCNGNVDTAHNQLEELELTARFILLEYEAHFKLFCQKYCATYSVHRLQFKCDQLIWIETVGNKMHSLQISMCDNSAQSVYMDNEILRVLNERNQIAPLILCDSPGMGKTTLLANLAMQTQKSGSIVLFFVIPDFITAVKQRLNIIDTNLDGALKTEVISDASSYNLQQEMFFRQHETNKLFMFFDGLDEVPVDCVEFSLKCLQRLNEIFNGAKIHIATRPHLLAQVECWFSSLGYSIQPFELDNQIEFLMNYWSHERVVRKLKVNTIELERYTRQCLFTLASTLTPTDNAIAGIPLQCLLIGEVFENEAALYADPENLRLAKDSKLFIQIKSITDLYDKMIERKFSSFERRMLRQNHKQIFIKPLNTLHLFLSIQRVFTCNEWAEKMRFVTLTEKLFERLKELFPEWRVSLAEFKNGQLPTQQILSVGILEEVQDGKLQFVHRTFAEYFLAKFAVQQYTRDFSCHSSETMEKIVQFINTAVLETKSVNVAISTVYQLQQQTVEFKYPVVCHFMNSILACKAHTPNEIVVRNINIHEIVPACIHGNYKKLLQLHIHNFQHQNTEVSRKTMQLATRLSTPEMFDLLGYTPELFQNCADSPLHIAIEHGNYSMATHIYCKYFQDVTSWNEKEIKDFLRVCVAHTSECNSDVVNGKLKILGLLKKFMPALSITIFLFIIRFPMHVTHLNALLEHIEPDNLQEVKNEHNQTILHITAEYLSEADYECFLRKLYELHQNAFQQLCKSDYKGTLVQTLLRRIVKGKDIILHNGVMQLFMEFENNFNIFSDTELSSVAKQQVVCDRVSVVENLGSCSKDLVVGENGCLLNKIVLSMMSTSVSSELDTKWNLIALALGTPISLKKDLIRKKAISQVDTIGILETILEDWMSRKVEKATLLELIKILENNSMHAIARNLKDTFSVTF